MPTEKAPRRRSDTPARPKRATRTSETAERVAVRERRLAKRPQQTNATKPTTIDDYLSRVDPEKRAALERLRRDILAVIPRAEECISYQMPAFRVDGRVLVWFGSGANHCAFYPGGVVDQFRAALANYETSKGTIRFPPDRPLPASLVRKLVKARHARVSKR